MQKLLKRAIQTGHLPTIQTAVDLVNDRYTDCRDPEQFISWTTTSYCHNELGIGGYEPDSDKITLDIEHYTQYGIRETVTLYLRDEVITIGEDYRPIIKAKIWKILRNTDKKVSTRRPGWVDQTRTPVQMTQVVDGDGNVTYEFEDGTRLEG